MLSPERMEEYRRMSLEEKLALVCRMIRENSPYLLKGPPDVVARRFELLRRENDQRNERILRAIARSMEVETKTEAESP